MFLGSFVLILIIVVFVIVAVSVVTVAVGPFAPFSIRFPIYMSYACNYGIAVKLFMKRRKENVIFLFSSFFFARNFGCLSMVLVVVITVTDCPIVTEAQNDGLLFMKRVMETYQPLVECGRTNNNIFFFISLEIA